ncbi:MAG TPA: hypothetical protein VHH34_15750 [Pseudonocardiaceae bacterium]|nr:hypothetical protein [Pseudonocardiaceae bacterium]
MIPRIAILPLGPHAFAAFVEHSRTTSYHQVVLAPDFLAQVGLATADEEVVAHEALAFLLRTRRVRQLPDVLQLTAPFRADPLLLSELRARLG